MVQPPMSVVEQLALRLVMPGDAGLPLAATLRYDAHDPFAVLATFSAGEESISWVLGRDLLSEGLAGASGEGDVRVWPATTGGDELVMLQLSSPDGSALLAADQQELESFLSRTYALVGLGDEGDHLDVDGTISRLLDAA
jgi:hypothetical protein